MIEDSPRRGEVWTVNFNPGRGSEQRGTRPALVIQNDVGNRYSRTTVVAAITTTIKAFPATVTLDRGEGGLEARSMVNLAQIVTVDASRLMSKLGSLHARTMLKVDEAIRISLDVG